MVQENVLRLAAVIKIRLEEAVAREHYALPPCFSRGSTSMRPSSEDSGAEVDGAGLLSSLSARVRCGLVASLGTRGRAGIGCEVGGGWAGFPPTFADFPFFFWVVHFAPPITCSAFLPRSVHTGHLGGAEHSFDMWPGLPHL